MQAAVPAVKSWTPNPGPLLLGLPGDDTVTTFALLDAEDAEEFEADMTAIIFSNIFSVSLVGIDDDSLDDEQTPRVHSNLQDLFFNVEFHSTGT